MRKFRLVFGIILLGTLIGGGLFITNQLVNRQLSSEDTSASCPADKPVFCGGCLNSCFSYSELSAAGGGCNAMIDQRCNTDTQCAGNGVSAGNRPCCSGLTKCDNGRCGTSCIGPTQPNPPPPPTGGTPECTIGNIRSTGSCGEGTCGDNQRPVSVCRGSTGDNRYVTECVNFANCTTTGGGTGTPNTPGQCAAGGASCEGTSCCTGLVCQGVQGSRKCQDPSAPLNGGDVCPGNGTCTGYISFSCSQLDGNGECHQNPIDDNSPSHVNGCGQIDQVCIGGTRNRELCGSFTIYNSSCSGTTTPPPPTTTPPPTVVTLSCGSTCSTNAQCGVGHKCSGGVCTKNTCLSPNVCNSPCGNPLKCGDACGPNNACPTGHTCSAGICKTNYCAGGGSCTDNACTPASCNNNVADTGEECSEPGLTCGAGNICNSLTCQCDPTGCGSTCSSDNDCPNDHSCNAGTCKLDFCLAGADNCSDDACEPDEQVLVNLPETDLSSQQTRIILLAVIIIIWAIYSYKGGVWDFLAARFIKDKKMRLEESKKNFEKTALKAAKSRG